MLHHSGVPWKVTVTNNGHVVVRMTTPTQIDGSFSITRHVAPVVDTGHLALRARNLTTGETCVLCATFSPASNQRRQRTWSARAGIARNGPFSTDGPAPSSCSEVHSPSRHPRDLGLAREESARKRSQEAQEIEGQGQASDIRERGSQDLPGS